MKHLSWILALVVFVGTGLLSAASFEKVIGGAERDRGVLATPTKDGGYAVVGVTRSFGAGDDDVYLVRLDSTGALLWTRTFGGPASDNGWSVRETQDGFAIAGFTSSFGAGGADCYLIKTDSEGTLQWSKTYGGEGKDRCWALAIADDGGFVLVGETTSKGAGAEDCFLVRTDSLGKELWSRTYGGEKGDRCFALARSEGGGHVLAGQTYSEGAGDRDAYIIKTDASGEFQWSRTFGGPASDVGHSIAGSGDDSFVVFGYTTSFATAGDDPYLIKVDGHGKTQWTRVLSMEGTNHTLTGAMASDGGFYLAGFSRFQKTGISSAVVVKTTPEGRYEWHRNILPTSAGESFGYTVRATPDGGCVFAGHTSEGSAGELDLLVVKVEKPAPAPETTPEAPPRDD